MSTDKSASSRATLPLLRKNSQNGEDTKHTQYKTIEINPTVDPKLFDKSVEKPAVNNKPKFINDHI